MEIIIRCVILSFLLACGCKLFFETLMPGRTLPFSWLSHTQVLAFMAGFLLISFTPIPPYIFQPVRFVLVVAVITQLYYQVRVLRNLTFSILLCSVYWTISALFTSAVYLFPPSVRINFIAVDEYIINCIFLCLTLLFHYKFKNRSERWANLKWTLLGFFPLLSTIGIVSVIMISESGTAMENRTELIAICGFAVINVCFFYFIGKTMEKEEEMQRLRLIHERTMSQMNSYRSIQKSYEKQRRQLHDYKNQLECIQGMLKEGQTDNALSYVTKLTGNLRQGTNFIDTNHDVVNIMLNKKYQEACECGIAMTFVVNDLSSLTLSEEEIVTLLGNLLDNAITACKELDSHKTIQVKMTLEDGQLILSVRNPTATPVLIKENKVITGKSPNSQHGLGLLNVNSVIEKKCGTSILKYDNGWFYFSAMIP